MWERDVNEWRKKEARVEVGSRKFLEVPPVRKLEGSLGGK